MKSLRYISAAFLICCAYFANAQKQGSVWCFGDSALVDFSDTANIITGSSMVKSRGSCASIADSSGNLLFYVSYDPTAIIAGTDPVKAYNSNHQVMANGDSMKGGGWYNEITIVPFPGSDSLYYIFYIGVTLDYGLYYSIVDMSANGGLGEVIQKNVQLHNYKSADGLKAIKHGNGRDWWIINRRWNNINNTFYKYLISPAGVSDSMPQNIGFATNHGFGRIQFSNNGNKMVYYTLVGLLELYDFDRCTGQLSNLQTIYPEPTQAPFGCYWGACFSPDDNLLYISGIPIQSTDTSRLYQFDLTATNIAASVDTLRQTHFNETMDDLKLAPDGKIYLATSYYQYYPYKDTMYNNTNMYLSTINSPNNLGSACDLQPYSFYLGGKRTYGGLPNNPDYELGALAGSACDTLTGISPLNPPKGNLINIYPNPVNNILFISGLSDAKNELVVYDIYGRLIIEKQTNGTNGSIDVSSLSDGVYNIRIKNEAGEYFKKRFVVIK